MKLFMDESGNGNPSQPLIVGAVELGDDADETEEKILDLYERLFARNSLAGFLSFEEFRKKGFHASNDPLEVSGPFLELIRDTFFRAYIVVTDRTGVPGDTESKRIEFMYVKLLSDILSSGRPAKRSAKQHRFNIAMVAKRDYMSTAVVDYVMAAVSRWILADRTTNPGHRPYRAFREIEPFISMLYSFEHGSISSRRDPLH
ncbi:hypothetical protein F3K37_21105 [Streptomyces sp. LBUM 1477]|nr:hypothetical protein [Streptomyces sp. LBUM 1477]MBP5876891.1 hypothetical protein [Streptomyces sp. LBUM 1477]